jgi:hypothetical protein
MLLPANFGSNPDRFFSDRMIRDCEVWRRKKAPGGVSFREPGETRGAEKETGQKAGETPAAQKPYTLNELPHPQVLFTLGLLNLNPEPSMVSM